MYQCIPNHGLVHKYFILNIYTFPVLIPGKPELINYNVRYFYDLYIIYKYLSDINEFVLDIWWIFMYFTYFENW